ncbi:hypothetical protein Ahy_A03g014433 isoform A [Arachis hypogaea]|uniref:Large ribosomal subunit protein bL12 C-terminal domain-containing protein n=1 Tax=Arachis hypogaea TaxID=3818 RepID=A0A445DXN1_ARAHY|nr:hypothetical protein Ahy_A03g014433 isoform A [Arachis hypogaea]
MSHSLRSLRRLFTLTPKPSSSVISTCRHVSTETRSEKLERIADNLLLLDRLERHDFSGGSNWASTDSLAQPRISAHAGADASAGAAAEEKTVFDIKLEKYDATSKIKIIKEVRAFTDLGLKEAKDLVEKVPCVLKKGFTKDEADPILQKLKDLGATVNHSSLASIASFSLKGDDNILLCTGDYNSANTIIINSQLILGIA